MAVPQLTPAPGPYRAIKERSSAGPLPLQPWLPDRNRGRADPLRRGARWSEYRQRAGNPRADRPHGAVLRPAGDRADGRGECESIK
jgi:hypothetical protein